MRRLDRDTNLAVAVPDDGDGYHRRSRPRQRLAGRSIRIWPATSGRRTANRCFCRLDSPQKRRVVPEQNSPSTRAGLGRQRSRRPQAARSLIFGRAVADFCAKRVPSSTDLDGRRANVIPRCTKRSAMAIASDRGGRAEWSDQNRQAWDGSCMEVALSQIGLARLRRSQRRKPFRAEELIFRGKGRSSSPKRAKHVAEQDDRLFYRWDYFASLCRSASADSSYRSKSVDSSNPPDRMAFVNLPAMTRCSTRRPVESGSCLNRPPFRPTRQEMAMFDALFGKSQTCEGLSRRSFLQVECRIGRFFASRCRLPKTAFLESDARHRRLPKPTSKDVNCILIWTHGGTSHHDTLDPKPNAPVSVRGEFGRDQHGDSRRAVLGDLSQHGRGVESLRRVAGLEPEERLARNGRGLDDVGPSVQPGRHLSRAMVR